MTLSPDTREPLNDVDLALAARYAVLLQRDKTGHPDWDAIIETAGALMAPMHRDLVAARASATAEAKDAEELRWLKAHPDELASAVNDAYGQWDGDQPTDFADILGDEIKHQRGKVDGK